MWIPVVSYSDNLTNCPCDEKCPDGCPCPNTSTYDCDVPITPSPDVNFVSGDLSINYPQLTGDCYTYTWQAPKVTPNDNISRRTKHDYITTWHYMDVSYFNV